MDPLHPSQTHSRLVQGGSRRKTAAASTSTVWPTAFALMFVANLIAPVASVGSLAAFAPKAVRRCHGDGAPGDASGCAPMSPPDQPPPMPGDVAPAVRAEPIDPLMTLKEQYSPLDVLRSIGTGSAPFRNFGDSIADMYALLTGNTVSKPMREEIQQRAHLVDVTTGLIPEVALLRLPSEVADAVADSIDGKPITAERIISIVQSADPRVMVRPLGSAIRPARLSPAGKKTAQATVEKSGGAAPGVRVVSPEKSFNGVEKKITATDLERVVDPENIDVPPAPDASPGGVSEEIPDFFIAGEQTYLEGYAQQIPADRLPSDGTTRLVIVDAQQYLRGEHGFYLASRAASGDHWLVDAPRRTKAQVPVTYDPHLDLWVAHEPQRLCGGGCGTSRIGTPDSIALNRQEVDAVLSHLRDDDAQNAILAAYDDVSRMKLLRSNRPDLRQHQDYSIIPNREAIRVALERIPPDTPLYEQQRLAAVITASHYRLNPGTEAFCQENAEVLFHFLIENGVHGDCIRMITIHPKGRSPHALVLYTESEELIDALELATPVEYEGVDGISGDNFAGFIMNARDSTLLLDPWSRVKAVGFALSKDPQETRRVLDAAFADVGHRPGGAFRVSLTRPLGPRRTGASRRGSLASQGSAGTASRTSSSGESSGAASSSSGQTSLNAPKLPLANAHERTDGA
ncbi:hypothetical protein [Pandoraea sputorum]|uniref:hypothetical protein n=1 Tax=Pandoraea sputorum TaxID=93222 RepID=UPI001240E0E9|nr:hypothetical protein [Pandoraea sputorum]